MSILSELRTRAVALLSRRAMESELDEEFAYHLDRETEKLTAAGMEPASARAEAIRRFGGVQRHREEARDSWGLRWWDDLRRDLRVALRGLSRSRGFAAVAILTMGLGIGGTLSLYGAVHALLVRALPFEAGDAIDVFWQPYNWTGAEYDHIRTGLAAYDEVAAYSNDVVTLGENEGRAPVIAAIASATLFDVLQTPPVIGRGFREGEDRPGAAPVIVLAHDLWQRRYGGDPAVVGTTELVDGEPTTIIGVMAEGFYFPTPESEVWTPLSLDPATGAYEGNGWLVIAGRRAPGASEAQVSAELQAIAGRLGERFSYPADWDKTRSPSSTPVRAYLFGEVRPLLRLLTAATALLLLMALVNVAALLLARMIDRAQEMRLRTALGAGPGRLVRQIVAESLLLSAVAGGLGIALSLVAFGAVVRRLPLGGGFADAIALDGRLLMGAFAVAVLLGAATSVVPAYRLLRNRPTSLRPGARTSGGDADGRSGLLQPALVAAQIVIAVTLVAGAALFARSVSHLYAIETGVHAEGVGAINVAVARDVSGGSRAFAERAVAAVEAIPGVRSAAMGVRLPFRDGGVQGGTAVRDRPDLADADALNAYYRAITPDYLATVGMRVLEGRAFTAADRDGAAPVALVNETFAAQVWPGESALGKAIEGTFDDGWATVVGVVADVPLDGVRAPAPRVMYRPWAQWENAWSSGVLTFRTDGDPAALLETVRRTLEGIDATAVVLLPTTLARALDDSIADALRLRFFMGGLALLALLIGAVGVYGVVAFEVARRQREFGIRMALGADRTRLVRGVLRRELVQVLLGVILGIGTALLAARAAAGLVWGVAPVDPLSLGASALILLAVGVFAAITPAVRASRVDPARVLRWD